MKAYINRFTGLARSQTAKDTYTLFGGNTIAAFLGFIYTLLVARALSIEDFGVFSAAVNLIIIITSFTDLGISSGAVNFISESIAKGERKSAREYMKAATVIRFSFTLLASTLAVVFAKIISPKLLATSDVTVTFWTAAISTALSLTMLFPYFLQAQKRFLASAISENLLFLSRLIFTFGFMALAGLTIGNSLFAFVLAAVIGTLGGLVLLKPDFLRSKPKRVVYKKLLKFSGWIGVNRIISSISGRLDITMLAALLGATDTGLYSIPSRLASFVVVLTSSFSGVLAPRLAGFRDTEKEKAYLLKATLALIPIVLGIVFWIAIADPFITILFGEKFRPAVPVFQALTASMIPFLFTVPSVSAIIYSIKKPVYIGAFSFFQIAAIFILNFILIPSYGIFGPTITFAVVNTILAIYTWIIVINYYWVRINNNDSI